MKEKTQRTLKSMSPAQLFRVRDTLKILEALGIDEVSKEVYTLMNDLILAEMEK